MKDRKLTGSWAGFAFKGGRLVTPEGRELFPEDLAWISLTAQLAQEYRRLLEADRRARGLITPSLKPMKGGIRQLPTRHAEPCPVVPLMPTLRRSGRG
ncbi:hypothetical protein ABB26_08725 [Stenotrophomonas humi]|uniref:Uncharacterized protein n=1 Tax=Stenotrophomonas humi TaxID=405444 RepID=A0A0R0C2Z9_9GAMM|nr:DUF3653 domain-containing protein [Stenotrophomonas humi]KRG64255.1 hypothetical protein ABB26_08725 [Stenotrophomonas humi]